MQDTSIPMQTVAAIEVACYDIIGTAVGRPVKDAARLDAHPLVDVDVAAVIHGHDTLCRDVMMDTRGGAHG